MEICIVQLRFSPPHEFQEVQEVFAVLEVCSVQLRFPSRHEVQEVQEVFAVLEVIILQMTSSTAYSCLL